LQTYLPRRYEAASAHVVDSLGNFSDQIDVVLFDRQYSTNLPIPHAGGTYDAKTPMPILGGVLTFESDWNPPAGRPTSKSTFERRLDFSFGSWMRCCAWNVLSHGRYFVFAAEKKPATAFLLELIARLQELATVPMIDVRAYASWLEK
jgi:hypothetical protein